VSIFGKASKPKREAATSSGVIPATGAHLRPVVAWMLAFVRVKKWR
jgi:hypothetical protein